MRILHVVEPFSSGIITFIILLTRSLPEHEHTVLHGIRTTEDKIKSVRSRFPKEVSFGIWKYADRSANPVKDLLALIYLYRYIKKSNYDVVHLHSAKAGFLGRIAGFLLRRKQIIYTPNGAPFLRRDVGQLTRDLFLLFEKLASKLSGEIICCGSSEAIVYHNAGMGNTFINNAVNIGEIKVKETVYPIKVGTMAILTYQKDPQTFNKIASHFKSDDRVEFTWVGGGALRSIMDEKAVKITGWVEEKEAAEYLNDFDIYLSTALWEGQPFAVLEAMQKAKCLILNECPGNIELVEDGKNGFVFKNADEAIAHLEKLIQDPLTIRGMGDESRRLCVLNHDLDKMGKAYDKAYRRTYTQ